MRIGFLLAAALTLAAPAAAQDAIAPGGETDPLGASGVYVCDVGDAAEVRFRFAAFEDGQYHIEESLPGGASRGVARFPWQLATATLFRERVSAEGATKFRRINGSLRLLQDLKSGLTIDAEYAEVALDGARPAHEWRYEVTIGARQASFAPGGLGEVEAVQVRERRWRYVDGAGQPLPLAEATSGLERREDAVLTYAPGLGVALRYERRDARGMLEACSLSAFSRP